VPQLFFKAIDLRALISLVDLVRVSTVLERQLLLDTLRVNFFDFHGSMSRSVLSRRQSDADTRSREVSFRTILHQ